MATLIVIGFIHCILLIELAQSQCASNTSYCLSGLNPHDPVAFLCSRYDYISINEGCEYFEHTYFGIYIHWNAIDDTWLVGSNISNTLRWAYCSQQTLDECTRGNWNVYYSHLNQTVTHYDLTIEPCDYDDTSCRIQYLNSTDAHAYDFCVTHSYHREWNSAISNSYSVSGCNEGEPFYTTNNNDFIIAWDNELQSWFMNDILGVPASEHYAFCTETDIVDCDGKWYIWNSEDSVIDTQVISGYCDTCTDVQYDSICVYFTESPSTSIQMLAGTYQWEQCVHLKSAYSKLNDNTSKLHYFARDNGFVISSDYDASTLYAQCLNVADITECDTNTSWSVRYRATSWFTEEPTLRVQIGTCEAAYETTQDLESQTTIQTIQITTDAPYKPTVNEISSTGVPGGDIASTSDKEPLITTQVVMVTVICVAVVILAILCLCAFCGYKHYHNKKSGTKHQKYSSVPLELNSTKKTDDNTLETPQQPGARPTPPQPQPPVDPPVCVDDKVALPADRKIQPQPLYIQTSYSQREGENTENIL
eukprot:40509_1